MLCAKSIDEPLSQKLRPATRPVTLADDQQLARSPGVGAPTQDSRRARHPRHRGRLSVSPAMLFDGELCRLPTNGGPQR